MSTKPIFQLLEPSITAPRGFLAAGVFCDIKRLGTGKGSQKGKKRDLGLLMSEAPATVAALFTTNQVCAAPVKVSIPRAQKEIAQAIVANSGNANACTGAVGMRDAQAMTRLTAQALKLKTEDVLVCSTGRIGIQLPMPNVGQGIADAARQMGSTPDHGHHFAEAIMTSDTRPKELALEIKLSGKAVRLAGVCKGAGMIQPGMSPTGKRPAASPLHATMLAFITTDAAIDSEALKLALGRAVGQSFNRITVDGDMSTNDSLIALANGLADNPVLTAAAVNEPDFKRFQDALNYLTLELACMIVRDGEGVSRFITVRLSGAQSWEEADAAARAVANSALVKTSWCGGDPNWGRVLDALGYSNARIDENRVDMGYSLPGKRQIKYALRKGKPTATPLASLKAITGLPAFDLHIHLNLGQESVTIYTADLTEAYVDFNKGE